ncbi:MULTISPECIES: DNA polymerase III subunit beta [Alicyclobacillus]|uniref:Beta sliding clamp n=1 Tax=Alicyclobacillus acidoterrestris (strain ATCC 49025 / DSM 3922 / CIP 106132 / NCIMB 13137 / GD3B) TaxID=1356854 RepID=T0C4E4_ALIAG|nr:MULTISPECIES: DNA polymerase III subunit beta [Alicyclobacillus]EPZ47879.1 hypothetical protein N007_04785 [Alicyclobacillus acidoterrestris ATCC 49025]UNO51054.1 DNA polymerase III subunit beta [Alicyclobacillus acidoterrestris]GEO27900.1 DNA polymerase III subunit beta [Alicyclobacillus acidoterrestris]
MKATFQPEILIKTLKDIVRVASSKTTVYRNVLITVDKDEYCVDFTASSETVSLKRSLFERIGDPTVRIEKSGTILVPAKELLNIVKFATDEVIFVQDGLHLNVRSGKQSAKIPGQDPKLFTPYQNRDETARMELPAPVLQNALQRVVYACSNSDVRPILKGVNLTISNGTMTAVSTDGLRLAKTSVGGIVMEGEDERELTIPKEPLAHLSSMLPSDDDETVVLEIGERVMVATWSDGETRLTMRALDGTYPDYQRIIPASVQVQLEVNRADLLRSCEFVSYFAGDQDQMRTIFEIANGELVLSAESSLNGKGTDSVPLLNPEATIEKMAFNSVYWVEALRAMSSEKVVIGINGPLVPGTISAPDTDCLSLISPVRLPAEQRSQDESQEQKQTA